MENLSHRDMKRLGLWFEKTIQTQEWKLYQAIVDEQIMGLLGEVLNDDSESPCKNANKRGRVVGIKYAMNRPHEIIEMYGTNGTAKEEDGSGPKE